MATKKDSMKNASNQALNKFFTQPTETDETDVQKDSTGISSPKEKEPVKKANKRDTKVFSFRADSEFVAQFRSYCFAKYGLTTDTVCESAMIEYMDNHPLEKFERDLYMTRLSEEHAKMQK